MFEGVSRRALIGPAIFGAGAAGAVGIAAFVWLFPPPVPLHEVVSASSIQVLCGKGGSTVQAMHLYAVHTRWTSTLLFLAVMGAITLAVSVGIFVAVAGAPVHPSRQGTHRAAISLVAVLAVGVTAAHLWSLSNYSQLFDGFLTKLLQTLHGHAGCESVRPMLWWARYIGEGVAVLAGGAMAVTATPVHEPAALALRIRWLQQLLYCGSILFVAGLMMSDANFTFTAAHWAGPAVDEKTAKAIAEIVKSGGLQAGVGYSALLVVFFLPPRAYLAWRARALPADVAVQGARQKKKALVEAGLVGSWQDDLKQVLALLAPILSAPLFDALLKGH